MERVNTRADRGHSGAGRVLETCDQGPTSGLRLDASGRRVGRSGKSGEKVVTTLKRDRPPEPVPPHERTKRGWGQGETESTTEATASDTSPSATTATDSSSSRSVSKSGSTTGRTGRGTPGRDPRRCGRIGGVDGLSGTRRSSSIDRGTGWSVPQPPYLPLEPPRRNGIVVLRGIIPKSFTS